MAVRILVLPVFQRNWLYHAWVVGSKEAANANATIDWKQGQNVQEKLQLLGQQVSTKVRTSISHKWRDMEASQEGTFQNRLYRLAQYVLSREDPTETCLKALPANCEDIEVIYPASLQLPLVRRRTRRMARLRMGYHERRLVGWVLATIPQAPLALTPLPNVTLYYTVYRAVSHFQARSGAKTMHTMFLRNDILQQRRMRAVFASLAQGGEQFEAGTWPEKLLRADNGQRDMASRVDQGVQYQLSLQTEPLVVPVFRADEELDRLVNPAERWKQPLDDETIAAISQKFTLPNLPDIVAQFKKKLSKNT